MNRLVKKLIGWILCAVMVVGMLAVATRGAKAADADAGAGEGIVWNDEMNRYEISSYAGLLEFAAIVNGTSGQVETNSAANAILTKSFSAEESSQGSTWTPIGSEMCPYTGIFDGKGYTIKNLTIESSGHHIGLFGRVGEGGIVQNVTLEGGSIKGNNAVGGVVGFNEGKVSNCYNTGDVEGNSDVGGVVGSNIGTVTNCYNAGVVKGNDKAGGVVGENHYGTVENCYNTDAVEGNSDVGGVAGRNYGTVSNCYNTGIVVGRSCVGGVAGYNEYGTVSNCHNTGAVSGRGNDVGGVVGWNPEGKVSNCYNTGDVSGSAYCVGGVVGEVLGGEVSNCYNTGAVSGVDSADYVGGVVGLNNSDRTTGTVSNCYNTGAVSGVDRANYVGGVAGRNYGTVSNCFYDKFVCRKGAIGAGTSGPNVTGLTTAKMTGENALNNMALSDSIWLIKAHGGSDEGQYYLYYPQLKGFNYKADGTPETDSTKISSDNWPSKVEVKVSWNEPDSYTYDGSEKNPTVTSIIVGDDSIPDGASVSYSAYGSSTWGEPNSDAPDSPGLYKMECDVAGEKVTKYFSILSPEVDYAVSCLKSVNENWEQSTESINSGKYKAVISWTENGYAIIEKSFEILPVPVTLTADSRDTDIYDGTEKSVSGFTCSVEGLTFDGVSANGKEIKQGKYDVTFSGVTLNDTKDTTGNYVVTAITNGTLTIKKKVLKITADSASAECDGTALTKNSYTISELAKGDTVESVTITGSQTGPGSSDNVPSAATIVDAAGEDVTGCYEITYVNGKLTVAEHSFEQEVVDAKFQKSTADCTHAAVYYKSCKCGEKGTETFESGEPLGHDYKAVEGSAVAPTCEKAGKEADQKCERCGDVITGKEIPATGHAWKAATGYAPKTCEICGATEGNVIKYTVEGGNIIEFTQGDRQDITKIYHRSEDDKDSFAHYVEVQIDGKDVKVDAKSGSIILTFDAATLNALGVGDHVITVIFDDWIDELKLVIKAPVSAAVDPAPTTGDSSLPVLWVTLLLLSMAGASVVVMRRRKQA